MSFLKAGALWKFIGTSVSWWEGVLELSSTSALFQALCFESGGSCQYNLTVELQSDLACTGTECNTPTLRKVNVSGNFYEYVEPTCVKLFFFNGQVTREGGRKYGWTGRCSDPTELVGGVQCCSGCNNKTTSWMNSKGYTCENANTTWPSMFTEKCNLACHGACFNDSIAQRIALTHWRGHTHTDTHTHK